MNKVNLRKSLSFLRKWFFVFLIVCFIVPTLTGCTKGGDKSAISAYKPVRLVWWRVWDDEDAFSQIIQAYRQKHPNVSIEYRKLRFEEYENELLEAMAEDRGPDILSIHNTWTERYQSKLSPMPSSVRLPVKFTTGSIKKEEVVEFRTTKLMSPSNVRKNFLDVVADDVVMLYRDPNNAKAQSVDKVWALPMSLDTLVLYYNKDILNNAGVIEPPSTWQEFQTQVAAITTLDQSTGEVLLAGAAIGTADNITRSSDILSLLMMQNLTPMITEGQVTFNKYPPGLSDLPVPPGQGALEYYTQFSSPFYSAYTWNSQMPNSLDAFMKGQVGFFFGYSYHRPIIEAGASKLNFDVALVPQVGAEQKVNLANYWVEAVSNKSENKSYAWDFLNFASGADQVVSYLDLLKKPTALRSTKIINDQLAQEDLAPFADQLLTARSWYHGLDPSGAEAAIDEMIEVVADGTLTSGEAIKQAIEKVQYTLTHK